MVSRAMILEIRRLLHEDELSHRAVAARLKISRGLVNAVACGRRGLEEPRSRWAAPRSPHVYPERCPGCGGLVYMPCRLCRTRAYAARQSAFNPPHHPPERPPSPRQAA